MKQTIIFLFAAINLFSACEQRKQNTDDEQQSEQIQLFNGENLDGWNIVLSTDTVAPPEEVFSVKHGVIHSSGIPNAYIKTEKEYSNYKFHVEWRWAGTPSNSGVLLHAGGDEFWPNCIEAQLMHENAGDIVVIGMEVGITVRDTAYLNTESRYEILKKEKEVSEKTPGEWNSYDILCKGDMVELTVNGVLQNKGTKSTLSSGAICLQSEGSPIQFRNLFIEPLK